jgi:cell division protein FtsB
MLSALCDFFCNGGVSMTRKINLQKFLCLVLTALFATTLILAAGCGPGLKEENEKLKREIADLTADNDKLKSEGNKLRGDASTLHSQMADLNMQIAKLQTQNQNLQNEIDKLKVQLKGKRR